MMYFNTEKVVIKCWCNEPEKGAMEQAKNLANLPFIFRQVRYIMLDIPFVL